MCERSDCITQRSHFRNLSRPPIYDYETLLRNTYSRTTAALQAFIVYMPLKLQITIQYLKQYENI